MDCGALTGWSLRNNVLDNVHGGYHEKNKEQIDFWYTA